MDKPRVTPKDFFLWVGAMISLYWSVIAFIFLYFNYIDYAFPNPLSYIPSDPYLNGVGYEMASIIVLFPIYAGIMWIIRADIASDRSRRQIWVRRWAIILTLFITGATIAIDLIALLTKFFEGESLTISFVLKVVLILLIAAGGFMHFIADFWGYWDQNPLRRRAVCWSAAVLAALSIIAGFFIIGTPAQARAYRFDEQKVQDLQNIQSEVVMYWQEKDALPQSLADLNDPLAGVSVPRDPQSGDAYGYSVLSSLAFKVCANFNAPTAPYAITPDELAMPASISEQQDSSDSWYHGAGTQCFARTIDPSRYPSLKKGE